MNEKEINVEEEFYKTVATLLNCGNHTYRPRPYSKRTRWNNREPGNGRFENFGIIRFYNSYVKKTACSLDGRMNWRYYPNYIQS